jgi:hemerythrin-like domain-containing protein
MTHKTLSVLRAEHVVLLSIARLLEAEALRSERGERPNIELVSSIVEYLRDYPCKFHHPKEEGLLFPALKKHGEGADAIAKLEAEHAEEDALIQALDLAASKLTSGGPDDGAKTAFATAAKSYARFLEGHVREEERYVFPLAVQLLTDDEWIQMDAAFGDHADPLLRGEDQRFRRLRIHIEAMGLPPFGL